MGEVGILENPGSLLDKDIKADLEQKLRMVTNAAFLATSHPDPVVRQSEVTNLSNVAMNTFQSEPNLSPTTELSDDEKIGQTVLGALDYVGNPSTHQRLNPRQEFYLGERLYATVACSAEAALLKVLTSEKTNPKWKLMLSQYFQSHIAPSLALNIREGFFKAFGLGQTNVESYTVGPRGDYPETSQRNLYNFDIKGKIEELRQKHK